MINIEFGVFDLRVNNKNVIEKMFIKYLQHLYDNSIKFNKNI